MQVFKGDAKEQKVINAGSPAFDLVSSAKDAFFEDAYTSSDFLLNLYDDGRIPLSARVSRESFVAFFRGALEQFPVIGTFESYLFILRALFGDDSLIEFSVPAPGKIEIEVAAGSLVSFEAIARIFSGGAYQYFNLSTKDGEDLIFRGIAGIQNEYELNLLFAELVPLGLFPTISLSLFTYSNFIAFEGASIFSMVDDSGNQLIFKETI